MAGPPSENPPHGDGADAGRLAVYRSQASGPDAEAALLLDLTATPTAAGREHLVLAKLRAWLDARPDLAHHADAHGNLHVRLNPHAADANTPGDAPGPVYLTAHLDHPAFVVERVIGPGTLELAFRGGVMDDYFEDARVELITAGGARTPGTLTGRGDRETPDKTYLAELDDEPPAPPRPGDIARWLLPEPEIVEQDLTPLGTPRRGRVIHTHACDDLAAAAAMLAVADRVRLATPDPAARPDARLLFTRAEEVGFVGALGAARDGLLPAGSRVIALENSRSFPADSPIGGGPIVRVGDRVATFTPELTDAVCEAAEAVFGRPAIPSSRQRDADLPGRPWQRKLMPGGACEAGVFCRYGLAATCVCLPLGNYHNMAGLAELQAGTHEGPPPVGREHVSLDDFAGMCDLLAACAASLPEPTRVRERLEKLWQERKDVLDPIA